MENFKRIFEDASSSKLLLLKGFWKNLAIEVKLGSLLLFMATYATLYFTPFGQKINFSTVSQISPINSGMISLKAHELLDIQNLVANTMSYSYEGTQLGFYLEDLEFFDSNSKLEAENIILKNLPKYLSRKAEKYLRAVLILSEKHKVDPIWILSVMWTESNFDYSAKSWAGARGLMQIMPDTRKFVYQVYRRGGNKLSVESEDFNIHEYFPYRVTSFEKTKHIQKLVNIELGIIYLKDLLGFFKNHKYATVAYNMGPGWTRMRLRKKLPVGQDNKYLNKVRKAYKHIVSRI